MNKNGPGVRRLHRAAGIAVVCAALLFSGHSPAGIETSLLEDTYGACTVRIVHDATPGWRSATLVFRVYRVVDGVHHRCPVTGADASESLGRALNHYSDQHHLKPVTSLFIRRLINYPWAADYLQRHADAPVLQHPSQRTFNKWIIKSPVVEPFVAALTRHGYTVPGVSCEKILLDDKGAPTDALCWLIIAPESTD